MKQQQRGTKKKTANGGNLGFEEKLWQAADKMRGHMDPAEYKHVVLGLIFLKYISDAFEERHSWLTKETANPKSDYYSPNSDERFRTAEDRDEYISENIFFVPKESRWSKLRNNAKQPAIGKLIDDAMIAIEKENITLKGVLPKDYARPTLDKHTLGELIDLISTIGLGDAESRSKDILGRVYEYFLGRFASAEGKGGGEFYTPQSVVKLLVGMIEPYRGRVYDPCCGSGGMFVQIEKKIYLIRGLKVMLDTDLAVLYGVTTKRLNEQVKRNHDRFPEDFMFQLNEKEKAEVVANCDHLRRLKFSPKFPYAFTEHGAIMLAAVLNSPIAVQASIQVVRVFVSLRKMLASNTELSRKLDALEKKYDYQFKIVFDAIRQLMTPPEPREKKIGFRVKERSTRYKASSRRNAGY